MGIWELKYLMVFEFLFYCFLCVCFDEYVFLMYVSLVLEFCFVICGKIGIC